MKIQQSHWCVWGPAVFKNDPLSKPEVGCWWWAIEEVDMAALEIF